MQTISFQPTAKDLIAANRLHYIASLRSFRFLRAFLVGGTVFAVIGAAWASNENFANPTVAAAEGLGLWGIFLAITIFGNFLQLPRRVRRIYSQQKALHDAVNITWTAEHVTIESTRGSSTLNWSDYIDASKNDNVIIFLQSDVLFNFIPVRALTEEQVAEIWQHCSTARNRL